jgi:hypothetical protein
LVAGRQFIPEVETLLTPVDGPLCLSGPDYKPAFDFRPRTACLTARGSHGGSHPRPTPSLRTPQYSTVSLATNALYLQIIRSVFNFLWPFSAVSARILGKPDSGQATLEALPAPQIRPVFWLKWSRSVRDLATDILRTFAARNRTLHESRRLHAGFRLYIKRPGIAHTRTEGKWRATLPDSEVILQAE